MREEDEESVGKGDQEKGKREEVKRGQEREREYS